MAPLFLDAGTDLDVRFKGNDMSTTIKFKANDVPTGLGTKLRNGSNLTEQQRHRQQAANANNYLSEFDALSKTQKEPVNITVRASERPPSGAMSRKRVTRG